MIPARALALLVTLLLTLPTAAAATVPDRDVPPMPDDLLALGESWARVDGDLLREHEGTEWATSVQDLLDRADAYHDVGRFRSMMNAHHSARVSIAFHALQDELEEMDSTDQERSRALTYGDAELEKSRDAFIDFRRDLAAFDGNLESLRAVEVAIYAAHLAMEGVHTMESYSAYRREVQNPDGDITPGLLLGLVDSSVGPRLTFERAAEILAVAESREGVRPVMKATAFDNFTAQLAAIPEDPNPQPHVAPFARLMRSAGDADEDLLLVTAWSASVRAEAIVTEQFKFADAAGRGIGAVKDLQENLNATLQQPVLATWTDRGFDGLAAREAVDLAWATKDGSRRDVATYVNAWIGLVHANFTGSAFGAWSPVEPPQKEVAGQNEQTTNFLPAPGALVGLAGLAGVAAARRSRRGRE